MPGPGAAQRHGEKPTGWEDEENPPTPVGDVPFPLTEFRTGVVPLEVSTEVFHHFGRWKFLPNFVLLKAGRAVLHLRTSMSS